MIGAEVVDTADKVDGQLYPIHLASKMTTTPNEQSKAGAEGSTKPLNESSIQDSLTKQAIYTNCLRTPTTFLLAYCLTTCPRWMFGQGMRRGRPLFPVWKGERNTFRQDVM